MIADAGGMSTLPMPAPNPPRYLIASADPSLLMRIQPVFVESGAVVKIARSSERLLDEVTGSTGPDLVLLDTRLPKVNLEEMLNSLGAGENHFPVVLLADGFTEQLRGWLGAGIAYDLLLRNSVGSYMELRTRYVLRMYSLESELAQMCEKAAGDAQYDRLTGVLNRDAIMEGLLRESDRVQRSHTSLTLVLFDIDEFGHWNSRLGESTCDELLRQVAMRTGRILRSYDLLGRTGKDEFLVGLPGCSASNAALLAERVRVEVFAEPYHVSGEVIRLSACFGIAQSQGRSPVVVLREAEQALTIARQSGPESIKCAESMESVLKPVTFLRSASGEELLVW